MSGTILKPTRTAKSSSIGTDAIHVETHINGGNRNLVRYQQSTPWNSNEPIGRASYWRKRTTKDEQMNSRNSNNTVQQQSKHPQTEQQRTLTHHSLRKQPDTLTCHRFYCRLLIFSLPTAIIEFAPCSTPARSKMSGGKGKERQFWLYSATTAERMKKSEVEKCHTAQLKQYQCLKYQIIAQRLFLDFPQDNWIRLKQGAQPMPHTRPNQLFKTIVGFTFHSPSVDLSAILRKWRLKIPQ